MAFKNEMGMVLSSRAGGQQFSVGSKNYEYSGHAVALA